MVTNHNPGIFVRYRKLLLIYLIIGIILQIYASFFKPDFLYVGFEHVTFLALLILIPVNLLIFANWDEFDIKEQHPAFWTSFSVIFLPIIFSAFGWLNVTVEVLLIPFVIAGLISWDYGIDSRFLIVYALLLLWLCPFLLMYKFKDAAEISAIYVFYLLVVGVILQIIETYTSRKVNLELEDSKHIFYSGNTLYIGIVCLIVFAIAYFMNVLNIVQAFSIWLGTSCVIIYLTRFLEYDEETYSHTTK
jgi:hypothetical protein